MPKYLLILRADTTQDLSTLTPDDMQRIVQGYFSWAEGLEKQGLLHGGHKLHDEGGRVMKPVGDGVTVSDGPFVEAKEVVGGYYLISANDYDHAVKLCEGHPNFRFGGIEIRELDFMGGPEELC